MVSKWLSVGDGEAVEIVSMEKCDIGIVFACWLIFCDARLKGDDTIEGEASSGNTGKGFVSGCSVLSCDNGGKSRFDGGGDKHVTIDLSGSVCREGLAKLESSSSSSSAVSWRIVREIDVTLLSGTTECRSGDSAREIALLVEDGEISGECMRTVAARDGICTELLTKVG